MHKTKYDIYGFRALIITISEQRKEHLRALAKGVDDKKLGTNLFWFACEKHYAANPALLLTSIWHTARDDAPRHLLEYGRRA